MSKELEALQDFSKLVFIYGGVEQYKIIEKGLKALEIIKEYIRVEKDENELYWLWLPFGAIGITKEEYDLLKEVLK